MADDAGANFSLTTLLFPLPPCALSIVTRVLSAVSPALATPFLQALLKQELNIAVEANTLHNIFWKLSTYVPSVTTRHVDIGEPFLKELQGLAQDQPVVEVDALRKVCPHCDGELEARGWKDRGHIQNNCKGGSCDAAVVDNRYKIFSLGCGVLYARFREEYCRECHLYYIGGWQYKKNAGIEKQPNFGKCSHIQYIGELARSRCFIIPKEKSWHAVDMKLLQFFTDEIQFSAGTFQSATTVWSRQHLEQWNYRPLTRPSRCCVLALIVSSTCSW